MPGSFRFVHSFGAHRVGQCPPGGAEQSSLRAAQLGQPRPTQRPYLQVGYKRVTLQHASRLVVVQLYAGLPVFILLDHAVL
eukprot:206326-Chlamydomonas_euryale.AAC.10